MKVLLAVIGIAIVAGCGRPDPPGRREPNPLLAPPIDSTKVRSADDAASWRYRREIAADLDGDRQEERLVIAADVETGPAGEPLWEDGHRWAVYVESSAGRTLLYAAFVPNGFTEAAALTAGHDGRRLVLVQGRTRDQLRALEVAYEGPGRAQLVSGAYYQTGTWLPGSARMPEKP